MNHQRHIYSSLRSFKAETHLRTDTPKEGLKASGLWGETTGSSVLTRVRRELAPL